jgi:hypothetical protein
MDTTTFPTLILLLAYYAATGAANAADVECEEVHSYIEPSVAGPDIEINTADYPVGSTGIVGYHAYAPTVQSCSATTGTPPDDVCRDMSAAITQQYAGDDGYIPYAGTPGQRITYNINNPTTILETNGIVEGLRGGFMQGYGLLGMREGSYSCSRAPSHAAQCVTPKLSQTFTGVPDTLRGSTRCNDGWLPKGYDTLHINIAGDNYTPGLKYITTAVSNAAQTITWGPTTSTCSWRVQTTLTCAVPSLTLSIAGKPNWVDFSNVYSVGRPVSRAMSVNVTSGTAAVPIKGTFQYKSDMNNGNAWVLGGGTLTVRQHGGGYDSDTDTEWHSTTRETGFDIILQPDNSGYTGPAEGRLTVTVTVM